MVKKKILKIILSVCMVAALCCSILAPVSSFAYTSGDGLPMPKDTEQVLIPLSLSFVWLDLNQDIHWVKGYPLALSVDTDYAAASFTQDVIVDGTTVGCITAYYDAGYLALHYEAYYTSYGFELSSRYPFVVPSSSGIGLLTSNSNHWRASFQYYASTETLTDDLFALSWELHDGLFNFGDASGDVVWKMFDPQMPAGSLCSYFSIYMTQSDWNHTQDFFTVYLPVVTFADNQQDLYDFFADRSYEIDRAPSFETIVTEFPSNWVDWLGVVVGGFFNAELMPGFTFGGLFAAVLGVLLFAFFVRIFKG